MITSAADLAEYLSHDDIMCLECGRRFAALGTHLRKVHYMTARDYRERWQIPSGAPLAGITYRRTRSEIAVRLIANGSLSPAFEAATKAAVDAGCRSKVSWQSADHLSVVKAVRPGDHSRLPDGSKRADGRDADNARQYQRDYRAAKG